MTRGPTRSSIYMESIGDARSFLSAAREVSLNKPIIVIKAGRTAAAAKAAASHTGSMTGSDDVLDAAFRRVGVLRVNSIDEVFAMTEVLAKQPRPKGPRLTDPDQRRRPRRAGDRRPGHQRRRTDRDLRADHEGSERVPARSTGSHNNPVDVLGDAKADRYAKALEICAKDPNSRWPDGHPHPAGHDRCHRHGRSAQALCQDRGQARAGKLDGRPVRQGRRRDPAKAGIPNFEFPDTAAKAFCYMWKYSYNLKALYETPTAFAEDQDIDRERAEEADRRGPQLRPRDHDRVRGQEADEPLWHSDRADRDRDDAKPRRSPARRRSASRWC